jgi:DDE domain
MWRIVAPGRARPCSAGGRLGLVAQHRLERCFRYVRGALWLLRREHPCWRNVKVRTSKYLNNLIEQDHRAIKRRCASMAGFKSFANAAITIAGIELAHRIRKRQFSFGRGRRRRGWSRKAEWRWHSQEREARKHKRHQHDRLIPRCTRARATSLLGTDLAQLDGPGSTRYCPWLP